MTFWTKADEDVCTNRQQEIDDLYEDIGRLVLYLNLSLAANVTMVLSGGGAFIYWLI